MTVCLNFEKNSVNINSWYKAIFQRYSVRNYDGQAIKTKDINRIADICERFRLHEGVRAVLVNNSSGNIYKGIIGSYGKIKGAPAYIAFVGDLSVENVYEYLGYMGEGIILEITSLGLGTCWISGTFNENAAKEEISLKDNEKILAITPVGYAAQKLTFDQKLIFKLLKKGRKSIEDITGFPIVEDWVKEAIDCARLAPSAVNRQPWRFEQSENNIILKVDKDGKNRFSKRLDCGIAMLHFELGALTQGVRGHWEILKSPLVAKFLVDEKFEI